MHNAMAIQLSDGLVICCGKCTTCNNDQMHNRPLTVCNAKSRAEVDEKKRNSLPVSLRQSRATSILVSFSFSGFSYRAFSRTNSIGESSILFVI